LRVRARHAQRVEPFDDVMEPALIDVAEPLLRVVGPRARRVAVRDRPQARTLAAALRTQWVRAHLDQSLTDGNSGPKPSVFPTEVRRLEVVIVPHPRAKG